MSLEPLELRVDDSDNTLTACDERDRAGVDLAAGAFASLTFEGTDESWGEFLDRASVAELHAWTGALLADSYGATG